MKIFKINNLKYDKNKKNILFMTRGDISKYSHVFGPQRFLIDYLKKDYNVFVLGTRNKNEENYIYFKNRYFEDNLLRKKDDPENYLEKNIKIIKNTIINDLNSLPFIDYIISENDMSFILPLSKIAKNKKLKKYYNEFFDYNGNDKELLKLIKKENELYKNDVYFSSKVSPIANITKQKFIYMYTVKILNEIGKLGKFIGFIQDPSFYYSYFEVNNIPSKFVYFVNDKRGTRNFEEFPIAQFQYNVYEKQFFNKSIEDYNKEKSDEKRNKNLLFAGTILQEKGHRLKMWDKFLKDLSDKKSELYIPVRKGSINVAINNNKKLKTFEKKVQNIIKEIENHPLYKGSVFPEILNEKFKEFKYGLCLRTTSYWDSLSFKPINYVNCGILPFFDYMYDPDYLQIPKDIQNELVVYSAKSIEDKIEYFNKHPEERKDLLDKLYKHFKLEDFLLNKNNIIEKSIKKLLGG